jgi:CHAT domain-containing protein/Tfp pilus assembly protein PilF
MMLAAFGVAIWSSAACVRELTATAASSYNERRFADAQSLLDEALARDGDADTRAWALTIQAMLHRTQGRQDWALANLGEALAQAPTPRRRATVLNQLALINRGRGQLDDARGEFDEALSLFKASGDTEAVAGTLNNLGNLHRDMGDDERASALFERALAIAEPAKIDRVTAYALNNLGTLAFVAGDYRRATRLLDRSVAVKERLHDRAALTTTYVNLGECARRQGHLREAFGWTMRALALASESGSRIEAMEATTNLAVMAVHDGKPHLALELATRALAGGRAAERQVVIVQAATARGHALRLLGRDDQALAAYDEAIAAIEDERAHAAGGPQAERALYFSRRTEAYEGAVQTLAASRPAKALEYAERAKARTLLDILRSQHGAPATPQPLPRGTAAIEFVTSAGSTTALVVTHGTHVRAVTIAASRDALARQVHALRAAIAQRDLGADALASALFRRLLGRAWPLVAEARHLVIVPDGALWDVPFQALRAPDGRYLIEHVAISLAPSLRTLEAMSALARQRTAASQLTESFGNGARFGAFPPLPEAERQARAVAQVYGGPAYVGAAATKARLREAGAAARVLHIAAHGVLDDLHPLASHLLLAPEGRDDGLLDGRDIARLPLRSDLVVLSACDTARGGVRGGEGVIGMAWALFVAGCPSTVVSQWSVDAATTTALMVRFHQGLAAGETKSGALQQAARMLLRDPRSRHPFYWAPFVVIGDDAAIEFGALRTRGPARHTRRSSRASR